MTSELKTCERTGMDYIEFDGHRRYLASIPSRGLMQSLPSYEGAGNPMFDVKEWFNLSRRAACNWIFDQNGFGSCVADGYVGALMRARFIRGMKFVKLSPGFFYSLINGNRDQGAVISDGIAAMRDHGTCEYSIVGDSPIFQRQMPASAAANALRFRIKPDGAYRCDTWKETVSAVLTGLFIPVFGYQVGNNFMRFDSLGVAGHDRGPGNHCNHADGVLKLSDGRWVLDDVNSWSTSFGDGGRCYIDEEHLFGGGDQPDVCVIRAPIEDPQEPNQPPPAA